jgi:tetratricopeptide (TPR) repeat protein
MAAKPEKPAAEAVAKPSLIARVRNMPRWVREHRIKAAVAFSVIFSIVGASLFAWAVLEAKRVQAEKERNYKIEDALAALDEDKLPEALNIAKLVQQFGNLTVDDAGGPAFIFGIAALQRAENQYDINRHHSYKIAAHWFDEAVRRGLPEDRRAEGYFLCGKTLVLAERYHEALPILREALALNPDRSTELHRYLASAYFFQPDPELAASLDAVEQVLASKDLTEDERTEASLLHAEICLLLGRTADAERDLATIPAESKRAADVLVLQARLLLAAVDKLPGGEPNVPASAEVQQRIAEALKKIAEARERDHGLTAVTPRTSYLAGLANLKLGKLDEAAEHFHQAYRRSVDGPEGLAAQVQSARLARKRRRSETAVSLYREVLDDVVDLHHYRNRWLSLSELKRQLLEAYDDFFARREFAPAAELAEMFPKMYDEDYAVHLAAEAHIAWARQLAETPPSAERSQSELQDESREHYRIAGKLSEQLATLRYATRDYPEDLWTSAKNYLQGADYAEAARQFRKYLEIESRGHHAEALVGLGEVLLVQERHDQALALLKQCLELHPRDPAVFRARLLLARLYVELNQWEPAEEVLTANLEAGALTPGAAEWRASLFALGRLLYDVGRYRDAVVRLDESVERYPDDPETTEARYRSAESHRRLAQSLELEVPVDALPAERAKYVHRAQEEYAAALTRFDETIRIARSTQARGLDEANRNSLLRNSLFARGSILHALGKYDEAIRAHQTAIASFPNSPAALDAYLQVVDCYRRLSRNQEARGTLEQAKLMLNRLPQDASFEAVSNYSRQEWAKLLDTLGSL